MTIAEKAGQDYKRVVVTGGAGFIGSHLCEQLLAREVEVHVADNLLTGIDNIPHIRYGNRVQSSNTDLSDFRQTEKFFDNAEPDAVFHFAAFPTVSVGADSDRSHLNNNILATYNVLEAMRYCGAKKFIFASTCTVYGPAKKIPTPETETLKPISLYGASKAACEALACSFANNYGFTSTVLRYANVVGPRSKHGVTYDFVTKLDKNPKKLEVLGEGTQEKSYVYVEDAVDATFLAAQKNTLPYDVFNVGSEDSLTTLQIASIVSNKMRIKPKIVCTGGQAWKGDVTKMLLDCSKIRKLGWKPWCNSTQAVEKTVEGLI